jgi:hypothetical protein
VHHGPEAAVKGRIGSKFDLESGGQGTWQGHARSESLYKWTDNGWAITWLPAKSYTEGHRPEVSFDVPEGKRIKVIYLPNKPGKPFNIVTKEANSEQVKVHNRFPVIE